MMWGRELRVPDPDTSSRISKPDQIRGFYETKVNNFTDGIEVSGSLVAHTSFAASVAQD